MVHLDLISYKIMLDVMSEYLNHLINNHLHLIIHVILKDNLELLDLEMEF